MTQVALPLRAKRIWPWVSARFDSMLLLLITFAAISPLVWRGWPHTADGPLHLFRLALLSDVLATRGGDLWPRWFPELVLGYGYPLLHFYAPAAYYAGLGLQILGLNVAQALVATFALMLFVAGFGMRLLALDLFSYQTDGVRRWQALVASTAYVFAPYLLTNLYVRGALAELGAQALLPWVFWSFRRLIRHERPQFSFLLATFSLALLALTHNISLLFIPPALVVYSLILLGQGRWHRGKWVLVAMLSAMGLSAFFWLPVLVERHYLAQAAFREARSFFATHAWSWSTFMDPALHFQYSSEPPFRLGLVQIVLAVSGCLLARRHDLEWLFWLGLALVAQLGITQMSVGIWQRSELLLAAQFPWRLLILVTPALALLTSGLLSLLAVSRRWEKAALLLIGVLVASNWPPAPWRNSSNPAQIKVNMGTVAQFEGEIGALGTSSAREFMPRWVEALDFGNVEPGNPANAKVSLQAATDARMILTYSSLTPLTIRWTDFYFPGRRALLDGDTSLTLYPSTPAGLLSVDLPAGNHVLALTRPGTTWQRAAAAVTLATALLLLLCVGWQMSRIPVWVPPVLFLTVLVVLSQVVTTFESPLKAPQQVDETAAFQLAGYRVRQSEHYLEINPYWFVHRPLAKFQPRWRLRAENGHVVGTVQAASYYDTGADMPWPPGTLADDAYQLPLEPGLLGGTYQLELVLTPDSMPLIVGSITLQATPDLDWDPAAHVIATFGNEISLTDYDLEINDHVPDEDPFPVARPGDRLQYTLYWWAADRPKANYHGTINLTDVHWRSLTQQDQHLGQFYNFPRLWHPQLPQRDVYRLEIPDDASSGLYWPRLAVYDFLSDDETYRLEAIAAAGEMLGSSTSLMPLKIVGIQEPVTTIDTAFYIKDVGTLIGYDIDMSDEVKHGATITVTLTYRGNGDAKVDYARFLHLYQTVSGLAAQEDGTPQEGINPTSTWVVGEIVVDEITLEIPRDTTPGVYQLLVGFYDRGSGVRRPIMDGDGIRLPQDQILLAEIDIQ